LTVWNENLHKSHNKFAVGVIVLKLATSVNQITKRLMSPCRKFLNTLVNLPMETDNQIFTLVDEMAFKYEYTQYQGFQRS
jgi:hypothetical protein